MSGYSKIVNRSTCHFNAQGLLHREDGPAATHPDGSEVWAINGQLHRTDGPAVTLVLPDGRIERQNWLFGEEQPAEESQ